MEPLYRGNYFVQYRTTQGRNLSWSYCRYIIHSIWILYDNQDRNFGKSSSRLPILAGRDPVPWRAPTDLFGDHRRVSGPDFRRGETEAALSCEAMGAVRAGSHGRHPADGDRRKTDRVLTRGTR